MSDTSSGNGRLDLLGTVQQDKVTGFKGVVMSVAFDVTGLVTVLVQEQSGEFSHSEWFDIKRVKPADGYDRVMEVPSFV